MAGIGTDNAPMIDGNVDAIWALADTVSTGKQTTGTNTATADVQTLWKDNTLYVLAHIHDAVLDASASDPWQKDSVEIYVDAGNYKNGAYRPDDTQIRINYQNQVSFGAGDIAAQQARLVSATSLVADGYIVEVSISLLNEGGVGTFHGLDFQVNDATSGARVGIRNWADPTNAGYLNTSHWGVGRLTAPVAPATPTPTLTPVNTPTRTPTPTVTFTPTVTPTPTRITNTLTLNSIAEQDGEIIESSETSQTGGSVLNSNAATFKLGDGITRKQHLGILSFHTAGLPDTAVITEVTLKVRKQAIISGGNPVTMFQGFIADIKKGFFGTAALEITDFQAAASKVYGPFSPALVNNWYSINLTSGKAYINKVSTNSGLTQIRLRFKLDDNNNAVANYLSLYSGDTANAANRPQLVIKYYVP